MELFLLRHAIAVVRGRSSYAHDSDRPLSPRGAKKMRRIAEGMQALDLEFDVILTSPFLRARQTADIVTEVFGIEKQLTLEKSLAPGGNHRELVGKLIKNHRSAKSVLLVGHEPAMSELVSVLISGDPGLSIILKKGGLCKLTVKRLHYGRCATLDWLLTPRHLARIE